MARQLLIRDLTLRDGQQSQFATRMNQDQVNRALPLFKQANFYAMEVWGGAVPDSIMRYLNENPWTRLESIRDAIGGVSKLTALSRGRNLFGYNPYPDSVIEGFCKNAVESGIGIMRIFDALNDVDNMKATLKYVKQYGGMADCAVCYTTDPRFTFAERVKAFVSGKKLPRHLFTVDYFVEKAQALESLGADMISIKDMAGLIDPEMASQLIKALKQKVRTPIDLHTHCTPGYGVASTLMAMVNGVDVVDTVILNFSGGPAAPGFEIIQLFANKLGLDTGVNLEAVADINRLLVGIRKELVKFDQYKLFPREFDIAKDALPEDIDRLFDEAVVAAQANDAARTLQLCQTIEAWFNYPPPDDVVKVAQIPGGMYTNMLAQLQQGKQEHLLKRVLQVVPTVRLASGCPPLVTPTSQIVGVQAVSCVIDEAKQQPFYTTKSAQYVNLVKGVYGRTPWPVDPAFREQIAGVRDETPYDTSKYTKQDNPELPEFGGVKLAQNDKEELLLELFPAVAGSFLKGVREREYRASLEAAHEAAQQAAIEAFAPLMSGIASGMYPEEPDSMC
jgi:pyruvate/oxaloacetate carboxyltransferase